MTDTLSVAIRLRALDDDRLRQVIAQRGVSPTRITDFFDLAEALLDPASVHHALTGLTATTLAVLAASVGGGTVDDVARVLAAHRGTAIEGLPARFDPDAVSARLEEAHELLLLHLREKTYAPYDAVAARFAAWPEEGLPTAAELAADPPPIPAAPATDPAAEDRLVIENAFSAVTTVTDLVEELATEPARELQRGPLAAAEAKRLADVMSVGPDRVPAALSIAGRAGLTRSGSGYLTATDEGLAWARRRIAQRWSALADAWCEELPAELTGALAAAPDGEWGSGLGELMSWLYPADAGARERGLALARDAETLGVTAHGHPSRIGILLLTPGADAATAALDDGFPDDVHTVYLQHDLTIVSPGPLAPDIDARLRTIAHVESRALAATYRVTAASVSRAVAAGQTAADILAFLDEISTTDVPQPLEYLVTEAAARYGRLRVRVLERGATRSLVHSDDPELIGTLAVDQAVAALGLRRVDATRLASRFDPSVVYWALSDARYPVALEDDSGRTAPPPPRSAPESPPAGPDPATELVARLRENQGDDESLLRSWRTRRLDAAIRARDMLTVSVLMPDGHTESYLLEPTGVAGGRLRGRDRRAGIERTLPLASIRDLS